MSGESKELLSEEKLPFVAGAWGGRIVRRQTAAGWKRSFVGVGVLQREKGLGLGFCR